MKKITDKMRLDFLQKITGTYTGKIVCRWSNNGRGWRLHESSGESWEGGAFDNVRDAIDAMMKREAEK